MADAGGGLYPVVLRLRGRRALVGGGGKVAARKAAGLLAADAHVVVVSPAFMPAFGRLVDAAALTLVERSYVPSDLEGMVVVVAATDDRRVNAQVSADARRGGVLVSVVGAPLESDFIVPAVVRRGDLLIAISTSGRSPALAGHLRRELELLVPDDWEVLVRLLGAARNQGPEGCRRCRPPPPSPRAARQPRPAVDATARRPPGRDRSDRRLRQRDGSDCSSASSSCAKRRRNSDSVSTA